MCSRFFASFFVLFNLQVHAVEFRTATYNIGAHFTIEGFPDYSLGKAGTPDHDRVRDVLARIDADVVALQEIASADIAGAVSDLTVLANSLGYAHIHVSPVSSASPLSGPIDTSLRVAFLSRHPFLATQVIRSPEGAREMTRLMPSVKVDIPGTDRDPVLISAHLKSGTGTVDRFRRTIEMRRLKNHLTSQGLTVGDNFIILGDFNLSSTDTTFSAAPSGLPVSYILGNDIAFPISYSTNPLSYFNSPGVTRLDLRQLSGAAATFESGSVIDLFLVSSAIAGRPNVTEIYNSIHDTSNLIGLPKKGEPLAAATSSEASDHYALFGDFELDRVFPNLALTLSTPTVLEGSSEGAVTLSVTLPEARMAAVTINIVSDDPAAAMPVSPSLTIPAGTLNGSLAIRTRRNFINDPQRSVTFTASAINYGPSAVVLQVNDADGPYVFTEVGQTVMEAFDGFSGGHDPAPWVSSGRNWSGADGGASTMPGFRAYGPAGDAAFGFLPGGSIATAKATFANGSAEILTALQVAFTAKQWREVSGGTADSLRVELTVDGVTTSLPELTYQTSVDPITALKSVTIENLSIPPGALFELRFVFTPGAGGGALSADVFVNEFHYDNNGTDVGEFVEVVVGPGFRGALADIDVLLVNGSSGAVYDTYNLGEKFAAGTQVNGFRFFVADTPSIQNGSPDGIAVVNRTEGRLLHFLSYEGNFNATSGFPAGAVLASADIGVAQATTEPVGERALGLIGGGGERTDFTWSKIFGAHSKGQPNVGQTFVTPIPSQGISFDDLQVTFLLDSDGDGMPDSHDADDDNDGSPDVDELVFGTDPLNADSRYQITIVSSPNGVRPTFPTTEGRTYAIEISPDLANWTEVTSSAGTGAARSVELAINPQKAAQFYRIRASSP